MGYLDYQMGYFKGLEDGGGSSDGINVIRALTVDEIGDRETVDMGMSTPFVRVSDATPTPEELEGGFTSEVLQNIAMGGLSMRITANSGGSEEPTLQVIPEDESGFPATIITGVAYDLNMSKAPVFLVLYDAEKTSEEIGYPVEAGVYCAVIQNKDAVAGRYLVYGQTR